MPFDFRRSSEFPLLDGHGLINVFSHVGYADITAGIKEAYANLPASGGKLIIPPGLWQINSKIVTHLDNLVVQGAGPSTILQAAPLLNDFIWQASGSSIEFRDIVFDGNRFVQGNPQGDYRCLSMTNFNVARVLHCTFHDANSHGLYVGNEGGAWQDLVVFDSIAYGCGNATLVGGQTASAGNGITVVNGNSVQVIGCRGLGNIADGIYTQSLTHAIIDHNVCRGNRGYGIELTTLLEMCSFSHNACYGNSESGIGADAIAAMDGVQILGNSCDGNGGDGIQLFAGSENVLRTSLVGNTCKNNSTPGLIRSDFGVAGASTITNTRDGISLSGAQKIVVVGNQCYDDQVTKTQRYAFTDGNGGVPQAMIAANNFETCATGDVQMGGTQSILAGNRISTASKASSLLNSAAATTPGSVVKKIAAYDAQGNLLGYVPIYDAIT